MAKTTYVIKIIMALIVAYILTGIWLAVATFAAYKLELADRMIGVITHIIYFVSCVGGGFYIGKALKKNRLMYGMLVGVCYYLIILLVSLLFYKNRLLVNTIFSFPALLCVAGGGVGSCFG